MIETIFYSSVDLRIHTRHRPSHFFEAGWEGGGGGGGTVSEKHHFSCNISNTRQQLKQLRKESLKKNSHNVSSHIKHREES